METRATENVLVCAGAVAGGVVGVLCFLWVVRQGFYALVLPGALAGLGAGLFRNRSKGVAIICGVIALVLGLIAEWRVFPFTSNESFGYFLSHLHQLRPMTHILLAVGAFIGFWVPFRRAQTAQDTSGGR